MLPERQHKSGSYKGKTILEAKRPLLLMSLDVEFYLAFHAEGKNAGRIQVRTWKTLDLLQIAEFCETWKWRCYS